MLSTRRKRLSCLPPRAYGKRRILEGEGEEEEEEEGVDEEREEESEEEEDEEEDGEEEDEPSPQHDCELTLYAAGGSEWSASAYAAEELFSLPLSSQLGEPSDGRCRSSSAWQPRDHPLHLPALPMRLHAPIIDPRHIYCTVPGRTSLLSSTTKYRVTVGEIQRRISPPECLNASLLGGILRKAKSKDGGKALRDSLRRLGIALPAGRRKQTAVTCWTALVEEEAVHMARDFTHVCKKEFHAREFAVHLSKAAQIGSQTEHSARRLSLHSARQMVDELLALLACDRTPLTTHTAPLRGLLDPHLQHHLSHFSLVTHGFGLLAMQAVLSSFRVVLEESLRMLERTPPPPPAHNSFLIRHHRL